MTGVIISLYFVACIYYLRKSAILNYKLWDLNTVTPVDWTVQINISRIVWIKWQNHCYMKHKITKALNQDEEVEDFKKFFHDEIQTQIQDCPPLFRS